MVIATQETPKPGKRTWRFSANDVLRMLEAGLLPEKAGLELIRGELVMAASQGPLHRGLVIAINRVLSASYPTDSFNLASHSTIWALPDSLPEPDIAVVRGPDIDYFARLPTPADTVLVLEVAVTTMADAREKAALYAEAGFPCYFLIDANKRTIDVYSEPTAAGYRQMRRFAAGEPVPLPETDKTFDLASAFKH